MDTLKFNQLNKQCRQLVGKIGYETGMQKKEIDALETAKFDLDDTEKDIRYLEKRLNRKQYTASELPELSKTLINLLGEKGFFQDTIDKLCDSTNQRAAYIDRLNRKLENMTNALDEYPNISTTGNQYMGRNGQVRLFAPGLCAHHNFVLTYMEIRNKQCLTKDHGGLCKYFSWNDD